MKPPDPPDATPAVARVHVGRQPIVDTELRVHAQELLFRPWADSTDSGDDPGDDATTTVILNTFTAFGVASLVGSARAFVNLTRPFIVGELPVPFCHTDTVLELLETVPVDEDVVAGVRGLREAGFAIALDDFVWEQRDRVALLPWVDYVKIDISQVPKHDLADTVARLRCYDVRLVAERVETQEQLDHCRSLGFDLFQGYLLLRPETLTATALNPDRLAVLELLRRLSDPDLSIGELESLVHRDAGLTLRVLQAANAAASGSRRRLGSVRDAVIMLGTQRLRAWVMLLVVAGTSAGREARLTAAVTTARTCELLAPGRGLRPEVAFTAGLVSRLDLLMGLPLTELLDALHLSDEQRCALVDGEGALGDLLATVQRYEARTATAVHDADVASASLEAMAWAASSVNGDGARDR